MSSGETLSGMLDLAWDRLAQRGSMALASQGPAGWPEVRTVMLRDLCRETGQLAVHTDSRSSKITGLRKTPQATLMLWDEALQLQIRAKVVVAIQTGPEVNAIWNRVPDTSRQAYGTDPAPGTPIDDALSYTKPGDRSAFAVLNCRVVALDVLRLGEEHRRAAYSRDDDWAGQWLAP